MKCPRCGLINPDVAQRCDCGFDFKTKTVETSYVAQDLPPDMNETNQRKVPDTYRRWFGRFVKNPMGGGQDGLILLLVGIPVTLSAMILGFSIFPPGLYPRLVLIAPGLVASMLLLYLLGLVLFKGRAIGRVVVACIGMAALWLSIVLIRTIYR